MDFLETFIQLWAHGEHPCGQCGTPMKLIEGDDVYKCPNCGECVEDDIYGSYVDDVKEREGYYDICPNPGERWEDLMDDDD